MSASSDVHDPLQPSIRTSERFSIDLSLELEHQLESMESSSVHNAAADTKEKHESLDPHVLAHIIMQLRHSLTEMTKERDELVKALAAALSKEAELNDGLQLMTDKASNLEEDLAEAKKKVQEGEEAVALLRSKVEESRRGLMRLQTESRRQSGNFETLRGATMLSFGGSPPASKRASFSPLTLHAGRANGHQRLSSMSDTSFLVQPMPQDAAGLSPRTSEFPSLDAPVATSRRTSGIFGRQSPPHSLHSSDDPGTLELESLRKELQSVRDDLEATKHRLSESNEAREASETCVKALRDFIAENNVGAREVGVPPTNATVQLALPPAMATGKEVTEAHRTTDSGGWSFGKLWKTDHSSRPSLSGGPNIMSPTVAPPPQTVSASIPTPLTKKFGGFFSSRSAPLPNPSVTGGDSVGCTPPFQSNATLSPTSYRGSLNSSDTSSITEPASLGLKEVIVGEMDLEYATVQGGEDMHETVIIG
ncbi:hypothetical protein M378DRAFT_186398 [Amanita muscaria Koide BX008]|uniref:Uncharacterized protein n=1 Tax=Amanita muscaria (strain Koide BX008) TaxID=946122 RepID=A0A0C2X9U1_AMAMK|nr:hypothetical protein M378DRAFT_186398 [Amanita muscaria Koide BX008]